MRVLGDAVRADAEGVAGSHLKFCRIHVLAIPRQGFGVTRAIGGRTDLATHAQRRAHGEGVAGMGRPLFLHGEAVAHGPGFGLDHFDNVGKVAPQFVQITAGAGLQSA